MTLITNFWQYVSQKIRPYANVDMNGKKISGLPTTDYPTEDDEASTKKYVDDSAPSGVPAGVICMWSGIIGDIPDGWALCDGGDGRPDLRSKFIRGAASGQNPGGTGGSDSKSLAIANLPSHTHTVSGTAASNGGHTHNVLQWAGGAGANQGVDILENAVGAWRSGFTSSTGAHTHSVSGTAAATGSGTAFDNRPAYYALAFIIKI